MQRLDIQLLLRLDFDRVPARPLGRLGDRQRVVPIVLLSLSEGPNALRCQKPHLMPQGHELMGQPMGARAGLEGDAELLAGVAFKEPDQLCTRQLLAQHDGIIRIQADEMKAGLTDIDADLLDGHGLASVDWEKLTIRQRWRRTIP